MKTIEDKAVEYAINELPLGYRTLGCNAYIDGAKEALAGLWRDASNERPEKDCAVLMATCHKIMIGAYRDGRFYEFIGVTEPNFWMYLPPIPELPKDENE